MDVGKKNAIDDDRRHQGIRSLQSATSEAEIMSDGVWYRTMTCTYTYYLM